MPIEAKRIAKNTFFLYGRMLLVMGVSFYTSRVILEVLGVTDYGLYFTIFSIIGLLSFLNGTLSTSTSRYITFEIGKGVLEDLKKTFSTSLYSHLFLSGIILFLGETIGLWYADRILVVPEGQETAAMIVYQISIFCTLLSIIQVPFSAEIIAHERMNAYAFLGIYEACAKLGIVFILKYVSFNKIILYGILQASVTVSLLIIFIIYNKRNFKEVQFSTPYDKSIFKSMIKFSGWNIIANLCNSLMNQGVVMLFNIFFIPAIVAAQTLANQISLAANQFVTNIRQAINPQIIKLYAEGDKRQSEILTIKSSEYILYLLLFIGVPSILVMPRILDIWLVDVPEMAIAFCRLMILQIILDNFNNAFYVPMLAANKISTNAVLAGVICGIQFFLTWLLFHYGLGPLWARYLGIFSVTILSYFVKPLILVRQVRYSVNMIFKCLGKSLFIMFSIGILSSVLYLIWPQTSLLDSIGVAILSCFMVILVSYFIISSEERSRLHKIILKQYSKLKFK